MRPGAARPGAAQASIAHRKSREQWLHRLVWFISLVSSPPLRRTRIHQGLIALAALNVGPLAHGLKFIWTDDTIFNREMAALEFVQARLAKFNRLGAAFRARVNLLNVATATPGVSFVAARFTGRGGHVAGSVFVVSGSHNCCTLSFSELGLIADSFSLPQPQSGRMNESGGDLPLPLGFKDGPEFWQGDGPG